MRSRPNENTEGMQMEKYAAKKLLVDPTPGLG